MQTRATLDWRSRRKFDLKPLSVGAFVAEANRRGADAGAAAKAQALLRLPALTLRVGDESCTLDAGQAVLGGRARALVADVDENALGLIAGGLYPMAALALIGDAAGAAHKPLFSLWQRVIAAWFEGRPLHRASDTAFRDRHGADLDLARAFAPEDDREDLAHFISETGFAHLRGWIDPAQLPEIERELLQTAAAAKEGEGDHLWTTMADGTRRCVRIRWALDASPTLAEIVKGPVYGEIGDLFADGHVRTEGAPFACEALIKPAGKVASVTDLPWHRDCGGIGCGSHVPSYTVGLPLSATNLEVGMLRVVAGSHRASAPPPEDAPGYDSGLPVISLPTEPGDLTIHVSCTLHGTLTSTSSERTVVYQSFSPQASGAIQNVPPSMLSAMGEARSLLIKNLTAER